MELGMICLTSKILLQNVCSYKCQFCAKVCGSSKAGLSSSYDGWAKYKEKYLMCQIPIKMLKLNSKLYYT